MLRILYIVNTFADEENPFAEPFVKSQIHSLQEKGVEAYILNIRGYENKINYVKSIFRFFEYVKNYKYDLIHGHYSYSGFIASLQWKIPSVVSFMGNDLYGSFDQDGALTLRGRADIRLSKLVQRYVDGIIVKSQEMLDFLIVPEKAVVLPNGVDFEMFRDIPAQEARESLGLSQDKIFVLFAGNKHVTQKCFHIVEKAVEILKRSYARYDTLVASGLPQEQVPLYMNAVNVLAFPSIKEGSPNVVKEALACNLPVVATDVGDVRELIGGLPGCRIAERTPEAFAEAIRQVTSRTETFNGRKAIEHLRIDHIADRLLDFYAHVIKNFKK